MDCGQRDVWTDALEPAHRQEFRKHVRRIRHLRPDRQARARSRRCVDRSPVTAQDRTGLWWFHDTAEFSSGRRALTPGYYAPELPAAMTVARSLAERKALTPINHFCNAGAADAGLQLHFAIDWSARTLRLQLYHPPDPAAAPFAGPNGAAKSLWWFTHAREVRWTPSEVLTVPLPPAAESHRPALLLWGPMTVSEIAPPKEFPLSAR
jgi:hypothetical protein